MPRSTVGRIETGAVDPRISTLDRLLRACEFDLEVEPLLGIGVDRSQIREMLDLSPSERLARSVQGAQFVALLRQAHRAGAAAKLAILGEERDRD